MHKIVLLNHLYLYLFERVVSVHQGTPHTRKTGFTRAMPNTLKMGCSHKYFNSTKLSRKATSRIIETIEIYKRKDKKKSSPLNKQIYVLVLINHNHVCI